MQLTVAKLVALALTWTLAVIALPSSIDKWPDVSRRSDFESSSVLRGINCDGNSECGDYCHVDIMKIRNFIDQIADDKTFSNLEQIACHSCWDGPPPLDSPKHGICVFARDLKAGKTVTAKLVKGKLNALIRYGCGTCGSNPTEPSNDVKDGQIKVDFTRDFCGTGVCNNTVTPTHEALKAGSLSEDDDQEICRANARRCHDDKVQECDVQGDWYDRQICPAGQTCEENCDRRGDCSPYCKTATPASAPRTDSLPISPRDGDVHTMLGLNCRGSGYCNISCGRNIWQLKAHVDTISNDREYSNGQRLACVKCHADSGGFCAFPQKMGRNEKMSAQTAKEKVDRLIKHGCTRCGSVPLKPGNNVNFGELTVNYMSKICKDGVC